jgi:hypothetical protein
MRHWLVLVLFLLGLGTLRVAACGEDPSCLSDEDCDDGNPCTIDYCWRYDPDDPMGCEVVRRCGHSYWQLDGTPCGSDKICVGGTCRENLCKDDVCDDGLECTEDECDIYDGTCDYTNLCDDGDDCTEDICNPEDGLCDFTTLAEDGTGCGFDEGQIGICKAGACVGPCDPRSNQIYPCPGEPIPDYFCCPGREYCIEGGC